MKGKSEKVNAIIGKVLVPFQVIMQVLGEKVVINIIIARENKKSAIGKNNCS